MKSGFVAVAGRPNVGKSTLVNALAGGKVAIVSDKPQTTRRRIAGVVNGDGYQLVLVDLPGFQRPLDPMTERMQRTVDQAFEDVDAVLLVLSARERIGAGDRFIARRVFSLGVPVVIVLNKVDNLKGGHIATQMETASKLGDFHALHPVSAKTGDGIEALREELVELLPEGPAYFPADQRSDLSPEEEVAELDPREGARADAGGGAACDLGRGRGDRREGRAREPLRRDRVAEADRGRQRRLGREGDRHPGAAGDRAPGWAPGLPRAAGQGAAEMAQRRAHARAPRDLMIELVYETHSTSTHNEAGIATGWLDGELSESGRRQAEELGARRRDDGLAVGLHLRSQRARSRRPTSRSQGRTCLGARIGGSASATTAS